MSSLRALELAQVVFAWVATASLGVALAAVRRREPAPVVSRLLVAALPAVLLTVALALGLWLAPPFERGPRQLLFVRSPALGWLYERQQHLLVVAVMLAWCAAAARGLRALRARSPAEGAALDLSLDVLGARAHVAALAFTLFVAVASTLLARVVRF